MNKYNIPFDKLVRYIRDLSIVIAGIAVTLYASGWVTKNSEKNDLKLFLNSIKIEMEENIKVIDEAMEFIQPCLKYSEYLQTNDKKSLSADTIMKYLPNIYYSRSFSFKTNAFEMFKSSGSMRLMNNKELLLSIWDVYTELADLKDFFDWYDKTKTDDMIKEVSSVIVVKNKELDFNKSIIPMYNFYLIGLPENVPKECGKVMTKAKELVERL
ncbi:MAG: hypothetical protein LBU83_11365 [Bacteroidales bacterium]|jgi:hypothetical protein|nr:hypothetical protein [Bacteroidales bacterium]